MFFGWFGGSSNDASDEEPKEPPPWSPFPLPEDIDPDVYLLLGDPKQESLGRLHRYVLPVGCGLTGIAACFIGNLLMKRPIYSSVHKTALYFGGGAVIGEWGYHKKAEWAAEKDLQLLHYISLHPEEFKAPGRVRYRDYLRPWHPFR